MVCPFHHSLYVPDLGESEQWEGIKKTTHVSAFKTPCLLGPT